MKSSGQNYTKKIKWITCKLSELPEIDRTLKNNSYSLQISEKYPCKSLYLTESGLVYQLVTNPIIVTKKDSDKNCKIISGWASVALARKFLSAYPNKKIKVCEWDISADDAKMLDIFSALPNTVKPEITFQSWKRIKKNDTETLKKLFKNYSSTKEFSEIHGISESTLYRSEK